MDAAAIFGASVQLPTSNGRTPNRRTRNRRTRNRRTRNRQTRNRRTRNRRRIREPKQRSTAPSPVQRFPRSDIRHARPSRIRSSAPSSRSAPSLDPDQISYFRLQDARGRQRRSTAHRSRAAPPTVSEVFLHISVRGGAIPHLMSSYDISFWSSSNATPHPLFGTASLTW